MEYKETCSHPNGHLAIEDIAMNRFFFICENCAHYFNLYKHEFHSEQLEYLLSEEDRRVKFKFIREL